MYSMKVFLIISVAFIALVCITNTDAAVFIAPFAYHPAHRGKCFDQITGRALLPNKEYKPKGICAVMTCDINTFSINIETCPYVEAPGCEELRSNPQWSFPKCCPQFKCVDFKTGKEIIVSA